MKKQKQYRQFFINTIAVMQNDIFKMNKIFFLGIFFFLVFENQSIAQPLRGDDKCFTVRIRGVYDSKVTVSPYRNGRYASPLKVVPNVKDTAVFSISNDYLPGQFLLRMDYRQKEKDQPYPSEFVFFMSDHDLTLNVNPLHARPDSIDFGNDKENPVYYAFTQEDSKQRQQLMLLEQLLLEYDTPSGSFYKQTINEFGKRRKKYNQWISSREEQYKDLFTSRLFTFQKVPLAPWNVPVRKRVDEQALHYFDEINLEDTLVLRTQAFYDFLSNYMRLFGVRATTEKLRDSLFSEAGRIACEKASQGDPKVYGWMVDYFYKGYESYNIGQGIKMLEQHIRNPNCLTSRKQEIIRRLEGMKKLGKGAVAPPFDAEMANGMQVHFSGISEENSYGLLIFYESTCSHCKELLQELKSWYENPENNAWFDVITIAVDDKRTQWKQFHLQEKFKWTDIWAPGGVNSQVCKEYYILSSPVLFIVDDQRKILATPQNIKDIIQFLN